jgi:hypothetical protein
LTQATGMPLKCSPPLGSTPTGLHSTKDVPPETSGPISARLRIFGQPCGDSGPYLGNLVLWEVIGPANFFSTLSRKITGPGVSESVMTGVTKDRPWLEAIVDAMSVFLNGRPVYG